MLVTAMAGIAVLANMTSKTYLAAAVGGHRVMALKPVLWVRHGRPVALVAKRPAVAGQAGSKRLLRFFRVALGPSGSMPALMSFSELS